MTRLPELRACGGGCNVPLERHDGRTHATNPRERTESKEKPYVCSHYSTLPC